MKECNWSTSNIYGSYPLLVKPRVLRQARAEEAPVSKIHSKDQCPGPWGTSMYLLILYIAEQVLVYCCQYKFPQQPQRILRQLQQSLHIPLKLNQIEKIKKTASQIITSQKGKQSKSSQSPCLTFPCLRTPHFRTIQLWTTQDKVSHRMSLSLNFHSHM